MHDPGFRRGNIDERSSGLIQATLDCVAEGGLQNATVREIARQAGVTPGLIRHYFSSKDALIQAAYRELMRDLTQRVVGALPEGGSPELCLRVFIRQNFHPAVLDTRTLSLWASFISVVPSDPAMKAIHHEHYLAYRQKLEALLADFFRQIGREVDAAELEQAAIAINGLIDGLWIEGCLAGSLLGGERLAGLAVRSVAAILEVDWGRD